MYPASRSFDKPNFLNMSYCSFISKSHHQTLAKARWTLSITAPTWKISQSPSPSPSMARCCWKFFVKNALSSGASGQWCQAFQVCFESVCVSRNSLMWCTGWNCAGTHSCSLHFFLLLHSKSSCCLHTSAWTWFAALGIFCSGFRMCLFVSFKV